MTSRVWADEETPLSATLASHDRAALNANRGTIRMPPLAMAAKFGGRGEWQNTESVGLLESVAEVAEAQGNRPQED